MNGETQVKKPEKAARILQLRSYHQPVFEALGEPHAYYVPKMFYNPTGKEELYVSFFKNELQKGKDIYTEKVDREYESEDETRTLYHWSYNMYWESQYEKTPTDPVRYLVPISDLRIIGGVKTRVKTSDEAFKEVYIDGCEDEDCDLSVMSMRDFAAIVLKFPVSKKDWLNKLIREAGGK